MSAEESLQIGNDKIVLKKKSSRNLRKRTNSDDDDKDVDESAIKSLSKLHEAKDRQKLRSRPKGVSVVCLALGKKVSLEEEITIKDPYNSKTGGIVNMQALKSGKLKEADDAYDVSIGTQFSAETNKRDEDEEMMKYIEDQLQQRKGIKSEAKELDSDRAKYLTPEEAALYSLPDYLSQSTSNRSEEMLSNQMLNGIPEVDLGIDAKIKNIEATEEAKQKLVQQQKNNKDSPSQFVPTNMAVNFMQHNRFNIEDNDQKRRKKEIEEPPKTTSSGTVTGTGTKKATDDYHYDKFKKQFRRY